MELRNGKNPQFKAAGRKIRSVKTVQENSVLPSAAGAPSSLRAAGTDAVIPGH